MSRHPPNTRRTALAVALAAGLVCGAAQAADNPPAASADTPSGEMRLRWEPRTAQPQGPLAVAHGLDPQIAAPTGHVAVAEALLRGTQRLNLAGQPLALGAEVLAWHQQAAASGRATGAASEGGLRVQQLQVSTELGAWALSAGKQVVAWDVGYGFRPNDMVQQEVRRSLLSTPPEGRPLLQAEHFDGDAATSLVWAQPQQLNATQADSRGPAESALALRHYRRQGAVDWHGFARLGRHTGASLGAAVAWVAGDELALHASLRWQQRHGAWATTVQQAGALARQDPWALGSQGSASQALVGLQWTGAAQQSLLIEAWHDGTALSAADWRRWSTHNHALANSPAPATARAGNLAWQATPLDGANLQRNSLFARLAWQPDRWQVSLDLLWHPADGGRIVTAGLQWQGDRWRINAGLRQYGGPTGSVLAQLPQRRAGLLAATWSF